MEHVRPSSDHRRRAWLCLVLGGSEAGTRRAEQIQRFRMTLASRGVESVPCAASFEAIECVCDHLASNPRGTIIVATLDALQDAHAERACEALRKLTRRVHLWRLDPDRMWESRDPAEQSPSLREPQHTVSILARGVRPAREAARPESRERSGPLANHAPLEPVTRAASVSMTDEELSMLLEGWPLRPTDRRGGV